MNLVEQITNDLKEAMKAQDKERLTVIRMVKASMKLEEIDRKRELNDELVIDVVNKQIKMRQDSIEEFKKANRTDLVEKNEEEVKMLEKYLPEPLSKEEVEAIINKAVQEVNATTIREMGQVMTIVSPQVKGRYDMKEVSTIIRAKLQ